MKLDNSEIKDEQLNPYGFDLSTENVIGFNTGALTFWVMGFIPTKHFETLKATVKVCLNPNIHSDYSYVLPLNLYDNDRLNFYCRSAAFNLKINEADIKKGICSLRDALEQFRFDEVKNNNIQKTEAPLSKKEIDQAREILKSDNLMECIEGLLKQSGLVTETENGVRLFLIQLSRYFDKPLHVLLQGSPQLSTMLLDAITSTVPVSELHKHTSMSPSSIYYTRIKDYWKHKVLCLTRIEKNFKGAATMQEFIENKFLKRQTTEADYQTRQLYASDKIVEGPICLMGYSNDDTLNSRFFQECFFIHVSENETNRVEMLEHLKNESIGFTDTQGQEQALRLLKEIQRQITPKKVLIPYAMELQIPDKVFQPLRSMGQLLTFIKTVALLHQHQVKPKKDSYGVEYIEATPEHLEIALSLFKSILIAQSDILSLSQRNVLERIKKFLKEPNQVFRVSELVQELGIGKSLLYRDFSSLVELGYVIRSGGNKKTGINYRLSGLDNYESIKGGTEILDEVLKKVKELGFHEVSTKIPRKSKINKIQEEQGIKVQLD
jgi:DNA primase